MKNDLSSLFEDPEFKESLAKYEGMVEGHTPTYFDADELIGIAEYFTSKGRHTDADQVINYAIQLHPNDTDVLIFRARTLAFNGKLEEAYQVARLIEDPNDREVKFLNADLLIEEGRMEEADAILTALAEEEKYDMDTLIDIIQNYIDTEQEEYADKWIRVLSQQPGINEEIQRNQGLRDMLCDYYTTFGRLLTALPLLKLTLELKPYSVRHWIELGKVNLQLLNLPDAHEAFDFALAIEDNNEIALTLKALAYRQGGNMKEAVRYHQKALEASDDPYTQLPGLIQTCIDASKYKMAMDYVLRMLEQYRSRFDMKQLVMVNIDMAICFVGLKQPKKAEMYIELAQQLDCTDPDVQLQIVRYYLRCKGKKRKAVSIFEEVLSKQPEEYRAETLISMASACFDTLHFDLALKYFEQVAEEFPQARNATLFFMLCCHHYLDDFTNEISILIEMKYQMPEVYEALGTDKSPVNDREFNDCIRELKRQFVQDGI